MMLMQAVHSFHTNEKHGVLQAHHYLSIHVCGYLSCFQLLALTLIKLLQTFEYRKKKTNGGRTKVCEGSQPF